jgi:23S rRNA U2552 (ribose-2'-O)-methylase RlmE/FtsJ
MLEFGVNISSLRPWKGITLITSDMKKRLGFVTNGKKLLEHFLFKLLNKLEEQATILKDEVSIVFNLFHTKMTEEVIEYFIELFQKFGVIIVDTKKIIVMQFL